MRALEYHSNITYRFQGVLIVTLVRLLKLSIFRKLGLRIFTLLVTIFIWRRKALSDLTACLKALFVERNIRGPELLAHLMNKNLHADTFLNLQGLNGLGNHLY